MSNFLSPEQITELKRLHKTLDRKKADKIKSILLLNKGYEYSEIADILILDDSTIRRWYFIFQNDGAEGLLRYNYLGSEGKLTKAAIESLDKHLEETVYLSAKEISHYIEKTYGVRFTIKGVTSLLHRMGFTYRKPKHVPGKANPQAQEKFIEMYNELKDDKNPEDRIWFMDAVHTLHNSQPAYGWLKKGYDYTIESNTGRQRVNINGAYSIEDHNVVIDEAKTINAQSTIALLKKLMKEQPLGILYIILDNARYYRSRNVREFLEKNPRIQLLFLPAYSPNLNIIERLWRFFKKKVVYNSYYEDYEYFRRCCINFFKKIENYKPELQSLMTENFQVITI
jgi:transposase